MGDRLTIAVLGPKSGVNNSDPGGMKRREILDALEQDGHNPFFPEDKVAPDPAGLRLLEQERLLLRNPEVDLVVILYTYSSPGALQEIAYFTADPVIVSKTGILYPYDFYDPGGNLFTDTLSEYHVKQPYSKHHLENCSVVGECRKWASARENGIWSLMEVNNY